MFLLKKLFFIKIFYKKNIFSRHKKILQKFLFFRSMRRIVDYA